MDMRGLRIAGIVVFVATVLTSPVPGASGTTIADIRIDGGQNVLIVLSDGRKIRPPKEKDQAGVGVAQISPDKRAAAWTVEFNLCSQSSPCALTLMVYMPGKPLRRFGGSTVIWEWQFLDNGKRVGFCTNFPRSPREPDFFLDDVETGRRLGSWQGEPDKSFPKWTNGMRCGV
jgi:hypothetical protein